MNMLVRNAVKSQMIQFKVFDVIFVSVLFLSHGSQLLCFLKDASVFSGISFGFTSLFAANQDALSCAPAFDSSDDRFYGSLQNIAADPLLFAVVARMDPEKHIIPHISHARRDGYALKIPTVLKSPMLNICNTVRDDHLCQMFITKKGALFDLLHPHRDRVLRIIFESWIPYLLSTSIGSNSPSETFPRIFTGLIFGLFR